MASLRMTKMTATSKPRLWPTVAACAGIMFLGFTATVSGTSSKAYIDYSPGGNIGDHLDMIQGYDEAGVEVRLRGSCWSACTLFTRLESFCAEPSGSLHFHAPYKKVQGKNLRIYSDEVTTAIVREYPEYIQRYIEATGGLGRDWTHLAGEVNLRAAGVPICDEPTA